MKIRIDSEYEFGDDLYIKSDPDQFKRTLVAFKISENETIMYGLDYEGLSWCYGFQISNSEDIEYRQKHTN